MNHLPSLISDLALILSCAGIITLIFKRLKQPVVLGYIVAGIIAGQHISFLPSVSDQENIKTWAEIGVIFLLFFLGLDFSIKKLIKVGGSAVIGAVTIIICMMSTGVVTALAIGWNQMDALFLGGMIAMSSTTIIYKAFHDLGVINQRFAGLVLSILVIEDILAILLMVMLSTVAVSHSFEGGLLFFHMIRLGFFLVLWFVVGLYVIPQFFHLVRRFLDDETLLVVSLGLCLLMVVLAAKAGFSPALGAFIMGSLLAETIDADKVIKLVSPVKDLFGAIFFVSVGMMVEPEMLITYFWPIVIITTIVILGQAIFGTIGSLLGGMPFATAVRCGFSLTQIGEFAFIIASLGITLKVTSDFIYPIVVAVSVITTFCTPYMIRYSPKFAVILEKGMPQSWLIAINKFSTGTNLASHSTYWSRLLKDVFKVIIIYSTLCAALIWVILTFLHPLIIDLIPEPWGNIVTASVTMLIISPFLQVIIIKKNHSIAFRALWADSRVNRGPLIALILMRIVVALLFVVYVLSRLVGLSVIVGVVIALLTFIFVMFSRNLKKSLKQLERRFAYNLDVKEEHRVYMGEELPTYVDHLVTRDIHLTQVELPPNSTWGGMKLNELQVGQKYDCHVVSILRNENRINIPGGDVRLFPGDVVEMIGTDKQLEEVAKAIDAPTETSYLIDKIKKQVILKQVELSSKAVLIGVTVKNSDLRRFYKLLLVGIDREGMDKLVVPTADTVFEAKDLLWLVGEEAGLKQFIELNG